VDGMETAGARLDSRRRTHDAVAARLAALSDDGLAALLAEAPASGVNMHGNQAAVIDVEGMKVFVKQIALTNLERTPANEGSTANVFGLPLFYQYGVGSAGFGAWRELDAYQQANAWTLSAACPYFPLLHHWRVMPRTPRPLSPARQARLQQLADYWDHSAAVRARLEAIVAASASIMLFLEHVPEALDAWLKARATGRPPDGATEAVILRIQDQWRDAAAFMNEHGMLHFDLHQQNVLTDGEQLYVADFGLALCADFDLAPAERAFFETHRLYDRAYVPWAFGEWLARPADPPLVLTPALRALIAPTAPVAKIFGGFIQQLRDSKTTPYPAVALEAALAALGPG
jgi:hypothetical protein